MQLGPDELLLNLNVDFRTGLSGDEVKSAVARIENTLRRAHPEIKVIYLEASALHPSSPVDEALGLFLFRAFPRSC